MSVLGESLYSTPDVAIRELVQNAHDACTRRRIEAGESEHWIAITADRARGTLTLEDPGAGLTQDEIVRYLATIGAGYTRRLRAETGDSSLIGMFGLGFLSAYVVADRISVFTTSYQEPDQGWLFQSRSGERFSIEPTTPRAIGTQVVLSLKERYRALSDVERLRPIVARYACLLPIPVHVGERSSTAVNAEPPPWRGPPEPNAIRADRSKRAFASRFEPTFAPLATIDVARAAEGRAQGLLWIQDGASYATSDNRNVAVFVRGMMITSDARELVPRWAGFVGGVIECDLLSPTASREDLMEDEAFEQARRDVLEALVTGLTQLAEKSPEIWRSVLLRHNEALLGACLSEPRLFDALADDLTIATTEGDLTVDEIRQRSRGRAHVSMSAQGGYEEVLFRALKVPVAIGTRFAVLPFLRRWAESRQVPVIDLGTAAGNRAMFPPQPIEPSALAWLKTHLARPGHVIMPTRFEPSALPLVLVPDREAELKSRIEADEADRRMGAAVLALARLHTRTIDDRVRAHLYVNLDAPVIVALLAARDDAARAPLIARAVRMLYLLVALITGPGPEAAGVEYADTLLEYGEVVRAMLEAR